MKILFRLFPFLFILFFLTTYFLQTKIDRIKKKSLREILLEELAYFPSGKFLKEIAIEYENLLSDWVWLRAIQYYGFHLMTDRKYHWLGHIFDILTTLDPKFAGAYHFGSITLAWDAKQPKEAIEFLKKGLVNDPLNWQISFDIAFIYYMLEKNYELAGHYFYRTAQLPGTWRISERWAAFAYGKSEKKEFSKILWEGLYNSTDNPQLKKVARRGLKWLKREMDIEYLQKSLDRYIAEKKSAPKSLLDLYLKGYIDSIPTEPFGNIYKIEDGKIIWARRKKR